MEHAPWQAEEFEQSRERARIGRKSVRICLFGVKVVASCCLMCTVEYVMGES